MSRLIRGSRLKESVEYSLFYAYKDDPNAGFSFDCDKNGKTETPKYPAGRANLEMCQQDNGERFAAPVVRVYRRRWREPAELRCDCNRKVYLTDPLDNYCDCGRCYNMSGQSVIPSSQCDEQGNPYDYD